jgi:hypothetical protein
MLLPAPRGPLSAHVIECLRGGPTDVDTRVPVGDDPTRDDDFQLALYLCYELHYTSIEGVDPRWEWEPSLLAFRGRLERVFEQALRELVPHGEGTPHDAIDLVLEAIATDDAPSVARFVESEATAEQIREFVAHRSAYHLKEADPHTWAIPRLRGAAKAAMVEIQADEYGGGRADRIHSVLFAKTMRALGLDDSYGAYLTVLPGVTLATVNLMTMFGLHQRLRGAIVGHLATFESTSAEPNGRYARGLRRVGFDDDDATDFFDEHVEADSVHEQIAIHDLIGGFVRIEPALAADVVWGARCLLALDGAWARRLIDAWRAQHSSLLIGREARTA